MYDRSSKYCYGKRLRVPLYEPGRANAGTNSIRGSHTEDEDGHQATGVGCQRPFGPLIQTMMEEIMSTTNALKLFRALKSRKSASGLLSDPVLERITQMDWEEIKAAADDLAAEGFITVERHYTIADDFV